MIEIKGKYNTAKVFIDNLESSTVGQLTSMCNLEQFKDSKIRIMPDCHSGIGCVIGTTMTITDKITPNLVGVDIGCGMLAIKLREKNIDFQSFDKVVVEELTDTRQKRRVTYENPEINNLRCKSNKAPLRVELANASLGTLGGGNHFLELDKDSNGNLWLIIHTGSRHLGIEVCNWYQKQAYADLTFKINGGNAETKRKDLINKAKREGRDREIAKLIKQFNSTYTEIKPSVPFEFAYCCGQLFDDYIHDMEIVQRHASLNREKIANTIIKKCKLHEIERIETIHNYIDTESMILRKGAISAKQDEMVIIPMNMRDGTLICRGKGNEDWNNSAPHGAGRLFSRSDTKSRFTLSEYKKTMKGIYSSSISKDTLDECPMAYKPAETIMMCIKDTVDIIEVLKPLYNFKNGKILD